MSSHFVQCMIKKAGTTEGLISFSAMNKDEILAKRKEACQAYWQFVAQNSVIGACVNWLEDLAEARATEALQIQANKHKGASYQRRKPLKEGETAQSKATVTELRQLRDREHLRTSARQVKAALGNSRATGDTMISVPDEDDETGPWKERTSQHGIEAGCRWENRRRFSQTANTSPMIHPLRSQLGFLGVRQGAQAVLDGTFPFQAGTDRYATRLLQ
jgi:hypothetical protein